MEEMKVNGETIAASQESTLVIEQYLSENYLFRRNMLNRKVEFVDLRKTNLNGQPVWKTLTQEEILSIVIRVKRENIMDKGNPKTEIMEYVQSAEVALYNPIEDFLNNLPKWDGQNHVGKLLNRIPGLTTEMHNYLAIWLRATVAHWLQKDMLHGNECVPMFIGSQGCGKTTFVRRLLPPFLRCFYLDHFNVTNKFDRDMALTDCLIVNLDEVDVYTRRQWTALKQILSLNKVNGRPIFGRTQQDRLRFASFVATTNNRHPLQDATGSRRFLCFTIPDGEMIDNEGEIDYEQLYAQIVYELNVLNEPYWYSNAEVARIQELNMEYMDQKDIVDIVKTCLRKPKEGEEVKKMSCSEILTLIQQDYPSIKNTHSNKVCLGNALLELGYEFKKHSHVSVYNVVPRKAA